MAGHGRRYGQASHHDEDPDPGPSRDRSGLGISILGSVYRSESHDALVANAAPIVGSTYQAYGSPPANIYPQQMSSPDMWKSQLSGRTLGGFSPAVGSQSGGTPINNLKESIYSPWSGDANMATHAPLVDETDVGLGGSGDRDPDAISLDSLQLHDGHEDGHHQAFDESFSTIQEADHGHYDSFKRSFTGDPPRSSQRPAEVRIKRFSWVSIWLIILSVYSTLLSLVWFIVATKQPRWGHKISSNGSLTVSTASMLTAVFAKTIELSFVTVFVAYIGQVLTRRAIAVDLGMTQAEMTMRTWVLQPGYMLANLHSVRHVGPTMLGMVTLIATLVAMFYTTASDAMVSPKLQFSHWIHRDLKSYIVASYSNPVYINNTCPTPVSIYLDPFAGPSSCVDVLHSGNSYRNLLSYLATWRDINYANSSVSRDMALRPGPQAMLYDNVTMLGTWIETQYSNTTKSFEAYQRVINNASLALPHPGLYKAATNEENNILQPSDLDGLGAYNISASVISPAVNVLCVNMNKTELAPLVYTEWPHANTTRTGVGDQVTGQNGWADQVPVATDDEWLNRTVVDDIFMWGEKYKRRSPVFQLLPSNDNTLTNYSVLGWSKAEADAVYILGKSRLMSNYTLCELRSWPAIQCSTHFDVSGIKGMSMSAECSSSVDYYPQNVTSDANPDAYVRFMDKNETIAASSDWKNMVSEWSLAIGTNGGVTNGNATNARILTELALREPQLNDTLPSMAEALAVLISSTLITGSIDTPFTHYWPRNYSTDILPSPGVLVSFKARVRTQEYASWHESSWQGIFYPVLLLAFLLNLLCLAYMCSAGLVKDFLDPANLFALATSSASSTKRNSDSLMTKTPEMERKERNSKKHLTVPYHLAYKEDADHYFFKEASDVKTDGRVRATGLESEEGMAGGAGASAFGLKRKSYNRLSIKTWL